MTKISFSEVEEWLDSNPTATQDYFLRKADLELINKWLLAHGFLSITEYSSTWRRGSCSAGTTSGNNSPISPGNGGGSSSGGGNGGGGGGGVGDGGVLYFNHNDNLHESSLHATPTHHRRNNSKKYLRHDFAKSKSRSVFRTCEPCIPASSTCNLNANDTQSRRSSLKGLRKYSSLPPNSINMLSLLIESKIRLPKYASKGRESKIELRYRNEREFLLDIVKDIANDLDLKSLTHKIITNLSILLDSDGASLFLVEGPRGKQILVSKVFDVHCGTNMMPTTGDNMVQVSWGKGILGYVAEAGETVNLTDASEDYRYNDEVDRITGYHTDTLLCMPVKNAYDEIIAVAQVINKSMRIDTNHFTKDDERLFETYLQFVGIAITNAQLFEASRREYERNRSLLEVVHDLFEEQTSLAKVVLKIMQRAQKLLKCERSAVLLLQENTEDVKFVKVFELTSSQIERNGDVNESPEKQQPENKMASAVLRMAEQVASSGEVLNIAETVEVEKGSLGNVRSLLSMPIRNSDYQVIGVAQIINRLDGHPFDDNDEQLFEAFTIFCGLGINNTIMYNELEKAMAKQKVAIEVLSYHTTAPGKEIDKLMELEIPAAELWNLNSFCFDDFVLTDDEMILAAVRMFTDLKLIERFKIRKEVLIRLLLTVRKNYRDVPYHNWRHAFNVAQMMFAILMDSQMKEILSELEQLAMFVGCLCHDLDHRGTNNSFQAKTGSALALLYGTKNTMEHHHFNHAVMILSGDEHNIFSSLSSEKYSKVMNYLKHSILSTDLSAYFQSRAKFFLFVDNCEYDWTDDSHREMLRSMLMTACDIASSTKPWSVQQKVAELVTREFFDQGDKEKIELNIQPTALMDRERKHELPLLQISWINDICLPLYKALSKINPNLMCMVDGALDNINKWAEISQRSTSPKLTDPSQNYVIRETGV